MRACFPCSYPYCHIVYFQNCQCSWVVSRTELWGKSFYPAYKSYCDICEWVEDYLGETVKKTAKLCNPNQNPEPTTYIDKGIKHLFR